MLNAARHDRVLAVTFDLDGTIIDSTEAIVESFFHTFDTLGEPRPERDALVGTIGHLLEDQFALFSKRDPATCARVYREYYASVMCDKTFLLPGAREALEQLRASGMRIGFATSKLRTYSERILAHLGVLDFFESRIGPREVNHPKPHPAAVLASAEALGVPAHAMAFVGDTHFDVLAAHAAGARCLCVTTGYATRAVLEALEPEAVYDSLADVTRHLLASADPHGQERLVSLPRNP